MIGVLSGGGYFCYLRKVIREFVRFGWRFGFAGDIRFGRGWREFVFFFRVAVGGCAKFVRV